MHSTEELRQFYSNMSGRELSDQEAFEADRNFVGFFDLLMQIDKRNKHAEKDRSE